MSVDGAARRSAELDQLIKSAAEEARTWVGHAVVWEQLGALHALIDFQRKPHLCVTAAELAPLLQRAEEACARLHPTRDRVSTGLNGI